MRRLGLVSVVLLAASTSLVACGDPPGDSEGGGEGSATMDTSMTSTTEIATSTSATGVGDASASGEGSTGASTSGTATAVDSTGSTDGGTGTGTDTGTGTTNSGSSDESTTGAPVCQPLPPQGDSCMADGDCQVFGDCCSCLAYNPNNGAPGSCGGGCGQTVCEFLGVDQAVCVDGTCQVQGLSCDQTAVDCAMPPPNCPAGQLPQVASGCYTGGCLPLDFCDWVPDCTVCPKETTCVITQTAGCDQHRCVPPFPECPPGPPTCNCLGQQVCDAPYDMCLVQDANIVCF